MSNINNELLLENLIEQFIEEGYAESVATILALKKFEDLPEPDYKGD